MRDQEANLIGTSCLLLEIVTSFGVFLIPLLLYQTEGFESDGRKRQNISPLSLVI